LIFRERGASNNGRREESVLSGSAEISDFAKRAKGPLVDSPGHKKLDETLTNKPGFPIWFLKSTEADAQR
jgi:hypothetical protein